MKCLNCGKEMVKVKNIANLFYEWECVCGLLIPWKSRGETIE